MVVEVVLGEVGKHRRRELTTSHPPLIKGVGAHLHGRHLRAPCHRFRQLRLQPIGKSRGVSRSDAVAWPTVHQGAEQCRLAPHLIAEMLDQMGGGGFAIRAGHPDQGHALGRVMPERSGQSPSPMSHRVGHHDHRCTRIRRISLSRSHTDHGGGGTVGEGLTPKTAAIHPFTRQSDEQGAMPRTAGIARERFKLWIREVFCHRQTHRMKKRMECLGHQPNTISGAVLIRSKRAGAGPL